eukprot:m51a1_g7199 putative starch phosphorylase (977) ;mRNA; f:192713-196120
MAEELHAAFTPEDVRAFGEAAKGIAQEHPALVAAVAAATVSSLGATGPAAAPAPAPASAPPAEDNSNVKEAAEAAAEQKKAEKGEEGAASPAPSVTPAISRTASAARRRSWIESVEHFPVSMEQKRTLLWAFHASYLQNDVDVLQREFVRHAEYTLAITRSQLSNLTAFRALAFCMRDRLIERWKDTDTYFRQMDPKTRLTNWRSLEFLMGRSLQNAAINLGLRKKYSKALRHLGVVMEDLVDQESDAGLGNGGLGRLAACYLDSMATLDIPAWGYGLRYTYGMFSQAFGPSGEQLEAPDYWLNFGNPWEIERLDVTYPIRFGGHVRSVGATTPGQPPRVAWEGGEFVVAVAYDVPVPGHNTFTTLNLRLWSSKPSSEFDFESFNKGDYYKAVENKQLSENITNVLYPNDNTSMGKLLRLKQQYFFVAATLRDIMARFKQRGKPLTEMPSFVSIQLNDTHPTLAIPELMRLLIDEEDVQWATAWMITRHVFSYTNHTVLPEALEMWPAEMIEHLLPRHWRLICEINHLFLKFVEQSFPDRPEYRRKLTVVEEGPRRLVRMAHLAIVGSHTVNGVAKLHTDLLKSSVFPEFHALWPQKFRNVTNGITPRRWLLQANPLLAELITETLGDPAWATDLSLLRGLLPMADNAEFLQRWRSAKQHCKDRLADYIQRAVGISVDPSAIFNIMAKRFHEYKRQLLNCLGIIDRWRELTQMADEERLAAAKRVYVVAGKAAPGYVMAKLVIQLLNCVSARLNADPLTSPLLKVVVLPNYGVSMAEVLVPASDVSQHISTAGMEASGTSNMKFALNGGLLLGTMDGANIEIVREIGEKNAFIFGARAGEVEAVRRASHATVPDARFQAAVDEISAGTFGNADTFRPLVDGLRPESDYFILGHDFPSWVADIGELRRIDEAFADRDRWTRMSVESTALMGFFSSDRSIEDYAQTVWNVKPCRRPGPVPISIERMSTSSLMPSQAHR